MISNKKNSNKKIKTSSLEIIVKKHLKDNIGFNLDKLNKIKEKGEHNNNNYEEIDNQSNVDNYLIFQKMNDYEINTLSYKDAIFYDKRTYIQYYWSILKKGNMILFSFIVNNDYNSMIIKICLFLFYFGLYCTVNALFFNDSTMHKLYIDGGKYDFIYQIPHVIYSTIISSAINTLMKMLSLTEKSIVSVKIQFLKKGKDFEKKIDETKKSIKIKFFLFFLVSYILFIFFWIYVACFCAVYKNTQNYQKYQIHLLL